MAFCSNATPGIYIYAARCAVSPHQMKGCRADDLHKGAVSITFLDDEAASDHGISGRIAVQLRQAGERLAVVIAAGAAKATTAAMSAAAMTAAARAAAKKQRHSTNTSRIAWEEPEWATK